MKTKTPLTPTQLAEFRTATNQISLESLRYAADICGFTPLLTETVAALEKIVASDSRTRDLGSAQCRQLYDRAAKSDSHHEPLLHAIRTALVWAAKTSLEPNGNFMVGNIVDPVCYARQRRGDKHSDEQTYRELEAIRSKHLTPYYERLKGTSNEQSEK